MAHFAKIQKLLDLIFLARVFLALSFLAASLLAASCTMPVASSPIKVPFITYSFNNFPLKNGSWLSFDYPQTFEKIGSKQMASPFIMFMDPKTPAGIRYLISFSVDQVDESTFNKIKEVSMGSMIEQTQVSKVLDHQKFIYDDKPSEKYTIILNSESPYSIYIQNMFFIYYENTIIHSNCMTITRSEKISLQDLKKFSDVKYKEVCTPFFESVKFNQVQ